MIITITLFRETGCYKVYNHYLQY